MKRQVTIKDIAQLSKEIEDHDAVLVYFSHEKCNVCKILKPKISELIKSKFSKIKFYYVDTVNNPEISGQYGIFTVPTIIAFFTVTMDYPL